MTVPAGAPRPFAICAAVLPLPYRFDASALVVFGFDDVHVALVPVPPPVLHFVQWSVELLGLMPGAVSDWATGCAASACGCAACGCAGSPACFTCPGAFAELPLSLPFPLSARAVVANSAAATARANTLAICAIERPIPSPPRSLDGR